MKPRESDAFDTTSLFMMQLACIVNMVKGWAGLVLRVIVCEDVSDSGQGSLSSSTGSQGHHDRLRHLLKMLRIAADIFPVEGWGRLPDSYTSSPENYLSR